jgi:hypothetical protein
LPSWLEVAEQFVLIFGAALLYFAVRGHTEGSADRAVEHSLEVMRFERRLGLDLELGLQSHVIDHHWLVTLANWVYIWGHWPVIALSLFWLHRRHRPQYLILRNGLFISGAIGLVIFALYPVAPPRLAALPLVDTVTEFSTSYRVLQPSGLVNKYAAMPSLHVGWNIIVGYTVFRMARNRAVRASSAVLPVLMAVAVVVTANHYVIDGMVGALVATSGLVLAHGLAHVGRPRPGSPTVDVAHGPELADEHGVVEDQPVHTPRPELVGVAAVPGAPGPHRVHVGAHPLDEGRRQQAPVGDDAMGPQAAGEVVEQRELEAVADRSERAHVGDRQERPEQPPRLGGDHERAAVANGAEHRSGQPR